MGSISQWIQIALGILYTTGLILLAINSWVHGQARIDLTLQKDLQSFKEEMGLRLETAGKRMSDLADFVQKMDGMYVRTQVFEFMVEERRREFLTLERELTGLHAHVEALGRESREDRQALHDLFNRLRDALDRRERPRT